MTPTSALLLAYVGRVGLDPLGLPARARRTRRPVVASRIGRALASRWLSWGVAIAVSVVAVALASGRLAGFTDRPGEPNAELSSVRAEAEWASQRLAAASLAASQLHGRVSALEARLEALKASKVRTVVETKTVTRTVRKWVPNGQGIKVEITGFEGMITIADVQLTRAYGYSDLIGIAVNRSGQTISYAQLGCTFLDAEGRVLANGIDNKQNWRPGQSWGFDCNGEVRATGGILRVDEMS